MGDLAALFTYGDAALGRPIVKTPEQELNTINISINQIETELKTRNKKVDMGDRVIDVPLSDSEKKTRNELLNKYYAEKRELEKGITNKTGGKSRRKRKNKSKTTKKRNKKRRSVVNRK